ncbi:ParB N-terminal domain-containing protein [Candidatus Peregrinibacteria bacterium]|nr:ParB N-terminal domain-containing protein [Candidatus Peregrinibacteria bacterium]
MKLQRIPIDKITPNKDNPRGIDILVQDDKLSLLKDSIATFGVLVPVVVTPKDGRYLLVDGERRYHAAMKVGLKELPAYIIYKGNSGRLSDKEILFRMFQIHHLREQWDATQQCAALEDIYQDIVKKKYIKDISDLKLQLKAIAKELVSRTGIGERTAMDRIKFLRWPKELKEKLYDNPNEKGYWYICEIEEKIIVPALINYPEYFEKVSVDLVRRDLYDKLNYSLSRGIEVRRVSPYFNVAFKKNSDKAKVTKMLDRLRLNKEMTYEEAREEFEREFPGILRSESVSPRVLYNRIVGLASDIEGFDIESLKLPQRGKKITRKDLEAIIGTLDAALEEFVEALRNGKGLQE